MNKNIYLVIGTILVIIGLFGIYSAFSNPYADELGMGFSGMLGMAVIPILLLLVGLYCFEKYYKIIKKK